MSKAWRDFSSGFSLPKQAKKTAILKIGGFPVFCRAFLRLSLVSLPFPQYF